MVAPSHDRSSESHLRVAPASRLSESNERTDERTDVDTSDPCDIPELTARAHAYKADDVDVVSLADVVAAGFMPKGERFEVVRTGEREPIPYQLRAAVWLRDRGICQKCQARSPKPWHLDHIVPWSAGGPDVSTNLRVLCAGCNEDRSNFDDATSFAKRPVTWWCYRCYSDPTWAGYWLTTAGEIHCPIHTRFCHLRRVAKWQADNGEPATWAIRSSPVEHHGTVAYCAHCGIPSQTDVTL